MNPKNENRMTKGQQYLHEQRLKMQRRPSFKANRRLALTRANEALKATVVQLHEELITGQTRSRSLRRVIVFQWLCGAALVVWEWFL